MKQDPDLLAAVDEFEEDRALDQAEAEELARQLEEDCAITDAFERRSWSHFSPCDDSLAHKPHAPHDYVWADAVFDCEGYR